VTSLTGRAQNLPDGLRILPLGGLGEIGMNCMVIEWQDEILLVDCGLLFSDLDHFGVQFVIPDFSYLQERKDKVKGILLTHGHEDHIGAVPFLIKAGIRAPIYCSEFTGKMLREKLAEYALDSSTDLFVFRMGEILKFNRFEVETVSVNHSIVDAAALLIKTPVGMVIHTGDFRIDPQPFYGNQIDLERFKRAGDEGVLLLMSDSTNVERHSCSLSESKVYQNLEQLIAAAEGMTIVAMFASNVARMGQIMQMAQRMGKKVALSGRGMEQNARLAQEIGYLGDANSVLITLDQLDQFPRHEIIVLSTGSQAELGSALTRVANGEHKLLRLQKGDHVLMSSRAIPGNEKSVSRMINQLFKQGAEVVYEAMHEIHASGHATRPELKQMIELIRPKYFIPIHGEYRHLVHHSDLALECGLPPEQVKILTNGDVVEVSESRFETIDRIDEPRVLIEGRDGQDVTKLVLKERRLMAEKGVVFSLMVRNPDDQSIVAGPEVFTKGLVSENLEGWLIEEARNHVKKVIADHEENIRIGGPARDLQENIRIELRRFFNQNIGKKPTVIPIILDL